MAAAPPLARGVELPLGRLALVDVDDLVPAAHPRQCARPRQCVRQACDEVVLCWRGRQPRSATGGTRDQVGGGEGEQEGGAPVEKQDPKWIERPEEHRVDGRRAAEDDRPHADELQLPGQRARHERVDGADDRGDLRDRMRVVHHPVAHLPHPVERRQELERPRSGVRRRVEEAERGEHVGDGAVAQQQARECEGQKAADDPEPLQQLRLEVPGRARGGSLAGAHAPRGRSHVRPPGTRCCLLPVAAVCLCSRLPCA
mmetsp:Transcript_19349/g.62356  ORF Transcript_19349/g.62356 Transcript_19349/m.62356 type:complete len:257 (+) Transcript_19349:96-866(+)